MLDSLVRVSRRVVEGHYANALSVKVPEGPLLRVRCCPRSRSLYPVGGYNTPRGVPRSSYPSPVPKTDVGLQSGNKFPESICDLLPFPFGNFTYCLTLFSKFFSSFHHCTCSLSVSRQYLALDGIYHPLRAAFPNNSTLRKHFT